MRIQHNVMAMNAYRNYTSNVNAMKQNLEKLASGYKINRAGDDAAGLAISEKMRAQITGLETAQKNAKDGISLVQTAEGALTEVHDMLNRMVELATQSANGTYDNDTDRYQLQKEMDQLRSEIDRIADSSNFNGIKLLDGSMDAGGDVAYTEGQFQFAAEHPAGIAQGNITLLAVGPTLGTDSVLHAVGVTGSDTNAFSVDLHNVTLNEGGKAEIAIGDTKITVDNAAGTKAMTAADIAKKIAAGDGTDTGVKLGANDLNAASVTINGTAYSVTAEGTRLTFTQLSTDTTEPDIPQSVSITDPDAAAGYTPVGASLDDPDATGSTVTDGSAAAEATVAFDLDGFDVDEACTVTFTIGGKDFDVEITQDDIDGGKVDESVAGKLVTAMNADKFSDNDAGAFTAAATGSAITLTAANKAAIKSANLKTALGADLAVTEKAAGPSGKVSGDWNASTTVIQTKQASAAERLASTKFTLTDEMVAEGSQITIGRDTYTFTTDTSKIGEDGYVAYNKGDSMAKIAEKLTEAAKGNKTYTVGTNQTTGEITITEVPGQTNFDLTTMAGIEKSLGFKTATTNPVDNSKGLTLQIGDTADSYNQLKVNIKDCHTGGLGIADISIANQNDAAAAVDAIKKAINYVSDVRGTLGATQNRLDHTMNNLSVMTENIQDAESTIRDVDIAEEMMAYTKNNILIQSAQAMLAQANQVPQGVLQLLQ